MARKLRIEYAGACYHVINRGNYRQRIFAGAGAAEAFERCLGEAATRFGWRVHAYVIMNNHFHLAVETPEPNLSEGMKWLQGTWVARFNRYRGLVGRPFQGRYKALPTEPGHVLAQVAHYIHLNPVRARIVPAERILDYRFSSLPRFGGKDRPAWLEPQTVLAESGGLADTRAGWQRYVSYLGVLSEEDPKVREKKYGKLSQGWAIGTAGFRTELKEELKARTKEGLILQGADREAHREIRSHLWEDRLVRAAKALGVKLEKLPPRKSAPEKVQLAALLKQTTSVSNPWLAERLQMGRPGSVTQYVRRFRLRGGHEKRAFRASLSKVLT
jgi:putative transposase